MEALKLSVPDAVRVIITRNPHLYHCMKMKVLNYNAVAKVIHSEVEGLVGKPVNLNTIVVAIMRFSDTQEKEEGTRQHAELLKGARLNLITGISDITIKAQWGTHEPILRRLSELWGSLPYPISLHQFPTCLKIIADTNDPRELVKGLEDLCEIEVRSGYAKLELKMSRRAERTPGVMAFITDVLYRGGISAVDAFFGYEHVLLILKEEDASRAFELLRVEVSRS